MKLVPVALVATVAVLGLPALGTASPHRQFEVVFVAERDGDADLYAANADGTAAAPLTANRVPDLSATLSPTGDHVAFWRSGRVVIEDLHTGATRVVARGTPQSWSPDGRLLAFSDARTHGLSLVSASGRGVRRIARGWPSYDGAYDVSWSPDGRHLTYVRSDGDMYVIDVRKGTRRHFDVEDFNSAVWAGRTFSYINDTGPGGRADLIVRDTNGRVTHRVPIRNFYAAQFSPDGVRLAWSASAGVFIGVGLERPRRVARVEPLGDEPYAWSPDSSQLAFVAGRGRTRAVWVAKADGSTVRRLGSTAGALGGLPFWSPDGRLLAFVRSGELDVVRADGTGSPIVLAHGRHISVVGWRTGRTSGRLAAAAAPLGPEVARGHTMSSLGAISELAAAGTRVAYLVPALNVNGLCQHIGVWDVATGKIVRFRTPCAATENISFYGLDFDGQHAEWSGIEWHNDAYQSGGHASLANPRAAVVVHGGAYIGSSSDIQQPVKHVERQREFGYSLRPAGGAIVLRRLRDGRTATVRPPTRMVDAVLARSGVFYTYTVTGARPGRIVFVPYAALFR